MAAHEPILHVVYAGRGDALILEHTDNQNVQRFILVDAGPYNFLAYGNEPAPYHYYLHSAVRTLLPNVEFQGIVLTHADDDHYGGLDSLKPWLWNRQQGLIPNQWHAPLYAPNYYLNSIQGILQADQRFADGIAAPAQPEPLIGNLVLMYPNLNNICEYEGPYPAQQAPGNALVPLHTNSKNHSSIILATATQNPIFLTGDSSADLISRSMDAMWPPPNAGPYPQQLAGVDRNLTIPRFSVYKLQHHGSIYDSMWFATGQLLQPRWAHEVVTECRVFVHLRFAMHYRAGLVARGTIEEPIETAAKRMEASLRRLAGGNRVIMAQFYDVLVARQQIYRAAAVLFFNNGLVSQIPWNVQHLGLGFSPQDVMDNFDLWMVWEQRTSQDARKLFNLPGTRNTQPNLGPFWNNFTKLPGWHDFWETGWSEDLHHSLRIAKSRAFFNRFESDCYVVSANGTHSHPNVETIIGLNMALRDQHRTARLYVTSANSIDVPLCDHVIEVAAMAQNEVTDMRNAIPGAQALAQTWVGNPNNVNIIDSLISIEPLLPQQGGVGHGLTITALKSGVGYSFISLSGRDSQGINDYDRHTDANMVFEVNLDTTQNGNEQNAIDLMHAVMEKSDLAKAPIEKQMIIQASNLQQPTNDEYYLFVDPNGRHNMEDRNTLAQNGNSPRVHVMERLSYGTDNAIYLMNTVGGIPRALYAEWVPLSGTPDGRHMLWTLTDGQNTYYHNLNGNNNVVFNWGVFQPGNGTVTQFRIRDANQYDLLMHSGVLSLELAEKPTTRLGLDRYISRLDRQLPTRKPVQRAKSTVLDVLATMIGDISVQGLLATSTNTILPRLLKQSIQLVNSDVVHVLHEHTFDDDDLDLVSVTLSHAVLDKIELKVDDQMFAISEVFTTLAWDTSGPSNSNENRPKVKLRTTVHCADGVEVSVVRTASLTVTPSPRQKTKRLVDILGHGHASAGLSLVEVLALVLNDRSLALRILGERLQMSLLDVGFAMIKPDFERSTARTLRTATGVIFIDRATLVCPNPLDHSTENPKNLTDGSQAIKSALGHAIDILPGLGFTFEDVIVELKNMGTSNMTATLGSSVSLVAHGKSIRLSMTSEISPAATSDSGSITDVADSTAAATLKFKLTMPSTDGLKDMAMAILGPDRADVVLKASVPVRKGGAAPSTTDKPDDLKASLNYLSDEGVHEVGFTLCQTTPGLNSTRLASVYVYTSAFEDWINYLPVPDKFKANLEEASVQVSIWNPLGPGPPRPGLQVQLQLAVPKLSTTSSGQVTEGGNPSVGILFQIMPLVAAEDYIYSLAVDATDGAHKDSWTEETGVPIADICAAVGMDNVLSVATKNIPILDQITKKVQASHLSLSIEQRKKDPGLGWTFTDWACSLFVQEFSIIPGTLDVGNVRLSLQRIGDEFRAGGEATFTVEEATSAKDKPPLSCIVSFALPSRGRDGFFRILSPSGISLARVAALCGSPDLFKGVPVIEELATINITKLELTVTADAESGHSQAKIIGFQVCLRKDAITLGNLKLRPVEFLINWSRDLRKNTTSITFSATASMDCGLRASLEYTHSSSHHRLSLNLGDGARAAKSVKMPELLTDLGILPAMYEGSALDSLVSDLALLETALVLDYDTKTHKAEILQAKIGITRGQEKKIPGADPSKSVALKELILHYEKKVEVQDAWERDGGALPKTPEGLAKVTKVFRLEGLVRIGKIDLKGMLLYQSEAISSTATSTTPAAAPEKSIDFILAASEALTLNDVLDAFNLGTLQQDLPEGCVPFEIGLDYIKVRLESSPVPSVKPSTGEVSTSDKPIGPDEPPSPEKPGSAHLQLIAATISVKSKSTLDIMTEPYLVTLQKVHLAVSYRRSMPTEPGQPLGEGTLQGVVRGTITIDNVSATLEYRKDAEGHLYWGFIDAKKPQNLQQAQKDVSTKGVLSTVLPQTDYSLDGLPSAIPLWRVEFAFRPKKSFFIRAMGRTGPDTKDWTVDLANTTVRLREFGLRIRVTKKSAQGNSLAEKLLQETSQKSTPDGRVETWEKSVFLSGTLEIPGIATSATAYLRIQPGKQSILLAQAKISDIKTLSTTVVGGSESVGTLVGPDAAEVDTMKLGSAVVAVNVGAKSILVSGQVNDLGAALFYAKKATSTGNSRPTTNDTDPSGKPTPGNEYVFLLAATRLEQIWSSGNTKNEVTSAFHIDRVLACVVSGRGSVASLATELAEHQELIRHGHFCFTELEPKSGDAHEMLGDVGSETGNRTQVEGPQDLTIKSQEAHLTKASPTSLAALSIPITEDMPLDKSAWFFAEIRISNDETSPDMSKSLAFSTDTAPLPSNTKIVLFASMTPKSSGKSSLYRISIVNLPLLYGSITVDHAMGSYVPGNPPQVARCLRLRAKLTISGGRVPFPVSAEMVLQPNVVQFNAAVDAGSEPTGSDLIANPFDNMFNLALEQLSISGSIIRDKKDKAKRLFMARIAGKVRLGNSAVASPKVSGEIIIINGKPTAFLMTYKAKTEAADVFGEIITPRPKDEKKSVGEKKAITWPSNDMPDSIQLEGVFAYYNTSAAGFVDNTNPKEKRTFLYHGFGIGAYIDIFGKKLHIQGSISREGLEVSGTCAEEIEVPFGRIKGAILSEDTKERALGPSLALSALETKKEFSISFGLSLFELDIGDIKLAYRPEKKDIHADVKLNVDVFPFKGSQIGFSYRDKRLHFDTWGFENPLPFDLEEAMHLKSLKATDTCGIIVKKVFNGLVKTRAVFELNTSNKTYEKTAKKLHLSVKWSCVIMVGDTKVSKFDIGDLPFELSGPAKHESLLKALIKSALDSSMAIADRVLSDGDILSNIMTYVGINHLLPQAIATLICKGARAIKWIRDVASRVGEWFKSVLTKIKVALPAIESFLLAVAGSAVGAFALAISADFLLDLALVAGTIFLVANLISAIKEAKGKSEQETKEDGALIKELEKQKEEMEKQRRDAVEKQAEATRKFKAEIQLRGLPVARYRAPGSPIVDIKWAHCVPDNFVDPPTTVENVRLDWEVEISTARDFANGKTTTVTVNVPNDLDVLETARLEYSLPMETKAYVRVSAIFTHTGKPPEGGKPLSITSPPSEVGEVTKSDGYFPPPVGFTATVDHPNAGRCLVKVPLLDVGRYELQLVKMEDPTSEPPLVISHSNAARFEKGLTYNTKSLLPSGISQVQARMRMISASPKGAVGAPETPETLKISDWGRPVGIASVTLFAHEYAWNVAVAYNWPTRILELRWNGPLQVKENDEAYKVGLKNMTKNRVILPSRKKFAIARVGGEEHKVITETDQLLEQLDVGDDLRVIIAPMSVYLTKPVSDELAIGREMIISTRWAPKVTISSDSVHWDLVEQMLNFTIKYDGEPDIVKDLLVAQIIGISGSNQFVLDTQPGSDNWANLHQNKKRARISISTPEQSNMTTMRQLGMGVGGRTNGKPDGPLAVTWGPRVTFDTNPLPRIPIMADSKVVIDYLRLKYEQTAAGMTEFEFKWSLPSEALFPMLKATIVDDDSSEDLWSKDINTSKTATLVEDVRTGELILELPRRTRAFTLVLRPMWQGIFIGRETSMAWKEQPLWARFGDFTSVECLIGQHSGLDVLSRKHPPTDVPMVIVLWTDDKGTPTSRVFPDGLASSHHPLTVPPKDGSDVNGYARTCVIASGPKEWAYWIDLNGDVKMANHRNNHWVSWFSSLNRTVVEAAEISHGGSIAAAAGADEFHIWWIGTDNPDTNKTGRPIYHAIHQSNDSNATTSLLSKLEVYTGPDALSPIAGVVCESAATVWFINRDLHLMSVTTMQMFTAEGIKKDKVTDLVDYSAGAADQDLIQEANPCADITVIPEPGRESFFRVFWIAQDYSVRTAVEMVDYISVSRGVRRSRDVSYCSSSSAADSRSGIAAIEADEGLFVFWFDAAGSIVCTVSPSHSDDVIRQWEEPCIVVTDARPRKEGRQILRVTTWDGVALRLWWVDENGRLRYADSEWKFLRWDLSRE
ncbi:hypothetical protein Neosp_010106 [[Neocosmospora] mangrovei]